MDALTCYNCDAVGTPMTMYWVPVEGDTDDEGQPVAIYGAVCEKHATEYASEEAYWMRKKVAACMPDTVAEADAGPKPTDAQLREWGDEEGASVELFAERCFEVWSPDMTPPLVPYGSTSVALPTGGPGFDEIPDDVLVQVAKEWWVDGCIDWVLDGHQEGEDATMRLRLVGTTTARTK